MPVIGERIVSRKPGSTGYTGPYGWLCKRILKSF